MFLLGFILYGTLCASWTWLAISFSMLGKFSTIISSKIFSYPLFFSSSSAAAAKSLQSCPTLCHPRDSSPPGSPVPFVNWFLYFLHFVFKVFDYLFILNSFSGSLPISSSFIWTSVFLVCSFIRVVFLCLFTVFFNLSSWKFPFPRLQGKLNSFLEEGWILASFWFLTS